MSKNSLTNERAAGRMARVARALAEKREFESLLQSQSERWRQEVANRVDGFRQRRSRKTLAGRFSLRLEFDPPRPPQQPRQVIAPVQPLEAASRAPGNVIQFPGPAPANLGASAAVVEDCRYLTLEGEAHDEKAAVAPSVPGKWTTAPESAISHIPEHVWPLDEYEFAEPIFPAPRILDVPETITIEPAPLGELALPPENELEHDAAPSTEVEASPPVASFLRRFAAGACDILLVGVATAGFGFLVSRFGFGGLLLALKHHAMPAAEVRSLLMVALSTPLLFWATYHFLFLTYSDYTPGMALLRLRFRRFDGSHAPRSLRCWRALTMVFSCASLGLGYLWALFDQERLCWHDRITRSCVGLQEKE